MIPYERIPRLLMRWRRILACTHWLALVAFTSVTARGFPYVVQPGDTLASIARRVYGRVDREALLVAANALSQEGGLPIVEGMRLEVPAVSHRRVLRGDTWPELATELLGGAHRAPVLAFANDSKPWLRPAEGAEIIVPYNLRWIATGNETLVDLAQRFLGAQKRVWMLAQYNGMKDVTLQRGQSVLVPLTDLALTDEGRQVAARAQGGQAPLGGEARAVQLEAARELPDLIGEVRTGRYVEAVARGERLLASEALTVPQRAAIHRQLLEAYAALGLDGRAADACRGWRSSAPPGEVALTPAELSPKLLAACEKSVPTSAEPAKPRAP